MERREVFLAGAVRTPVGSYGGVFRETNAVELGKTSVIETLSRTKISHDSVDELIFGHGRQAGNRPNPARQVVRLSGLPDEVPAMTVNQACASGLRSIVAAAQSVALGDSDAIIAGGMESMSTTPFLLMKARWGYKLGHSEVLDAQYWDGFMCPLCSELMGETAEKLVDKYSITREEQDEYSAFSQQKCESAINDGKFKAEIAPVELSDKKGNITKIDKDENPRSGVTVKSLSELKPVFREDGIVHAGASSGITDGAASVLVLSAECAKEHNIEPMARLAGYSVVGLNPKYMGLGPVPALRKLKDITGVKVEDVDLIEINEAFAAQVIACQRELNIDEEKLNVNGGAIALGHPIGCTGARIAVTLLHEMQRRKSQYGIATLCVSGGMGIAALFERV